MKIQVYNSDLARMCRKYAKNNTCWLHDIECPMKVKLCSTIREGNWSLALRSIPTIKQTEIARNFFLALQKEYDWV